MRPIAFHAYADDHRGYLSPSETSAADPHATRWVDGIMSPLYAGTMSELTNRQMLIAPGPGHLGPYVKAAEVFHCPSDRSRTNLTRQRGPLRVRSYSMNQYMVLGDGIAILPDSGYVYTRTAFVKWDDFQRTSPAHLWVFIDEHELTIRNGCALGPFARPAQRRHQQASENSDDGNDHHTKNSIRVKAVLLLPAPRFSLLTPHFTAFASDRTG